MLWTESCGLSYHSMCPIFIVYHRQMEVGVKAHMFHCLFWVCLHQRGWLSATFLPSIAESMVHLYSNLEHYVSTLSVWWWELSSCFLCHICYCHASQVLDWQLICIEVSCSGLLAVCCHLECCSRDTWYPQIGPHVISRSTTSMTGSYWVVSAQNRVLWLIIPHATDDVFTYSPVLCS